MEDAAKQMAKLCKTSTNAGQSYRKMENNYNYGFTNALKATNTLLLDQVVDCTSDCRFYQYVSRLSGGWPEQMQILFSSAAKDAFGCG